jgi:hypothetical protein
MPRHASLALPIKAVLLFDISVDVFVTAEVTARTVDSNETETANIKKRPLTDSCSPINSNGEIT